MLLGEISWLKVKIVFPLIYLTQNNKLVYSLVSFL